MNIQQENLNGYEEIGFSKNRNLVEDILREGKKKHHVNTFHGINIDTARNTIRNIRITTGEKISFTAFLIKCVAQALDENRKVHSFIKGIFRKHFITFNTVDVALFIERDLGNGETFPEIYIVRDAQTKSVIDITNEIRKAQEKPNVNDSEYNKKKNRKSALLSSLPTFIRKIVWGVLMHTPSLFKLNFGTAVVSSVGMFQSDFSQAVSTTVWPFALIVGGIGKRNSVDFVESKGNNKNEILGITMCIDHLIIDGAPAARYVDRLVTLIRNGDCLNSL